LRAAPEPNILFIILDDVGIDQMRLFGFGGTKAATLPNIARVAGKRREVQQCMGDAAMLAEPRVNQADLNGWATFQGRGPSSYDNNMDAETDGKDRKIIAANLGLDCLDICTRADLDRNGVTTSRNMALVNKQSRAAAAGGRPGRFSYRLPDGTARHA
jgi:hypothetical protein